MKSLWWIENKETGKLINFGRRLHENDDWIVCIRELGMPNPFRTAKEARAHCRENERPVRVKLVKV